MANIIKFGGAVSGGNAVAGDLLSGKTASVDAGDITGSMPNIGARDFAPTTVHQAIPAGYHNGSGLVYGDPDLVSANIKAGANIFGVAGNANVVDTSPGDAIAANLLSGKKAYVNGAQIVGSMPNKNWMWSPPNLIVPGEGLLYVVPPIGYYSGDLNYATNGGIQLTDSDFVADNIKKGINLFGKVGTYNPTYPSKHLFRQGVSIDTTMVYDFGVSVVVGLVRFSGSGGAETMYRCIVSGSNDSTNFNVVYDQNLGAWGSQISEYRDLNAQVYRWWKVQVIGIKTAPYSAHMYVLIPNGYVQNN